MSQVKAGTLPVLIFWMERINNVIIMILLCLHRILDSRRLHCQNVTFNGKY